METQRHRGISSRAALWIRALLPVLALLEASAAEVPVGPGGDPANIVIRPDSSPGMGSLDFPLPAFSALGSSLAKSGRFAEFGWTDAQLGAFIDGIRAAVQGKPVPMNEAARGLGVELASRMGGGAPQTNPVEFPLSAYSGFGSSLAQSAHFAEFGWSEPELAAFLEGIRTSLQGKGYPMDDAARKLAADMGRRVAEAAALAAQAAGPIDPKVRLERYFKGMRRRLGLQVSASGLGYNVQVGRNGIRPRPGDTIEFSCVATTADGHTRIPQLCTERIRVKMEGMMPGLMEGLQMMTVGATAVFVLPPSLSFGNGAWPESVERGAPLVYYIALAGVSTPLRGQ